MNFLQRTLVQLRAAWNGLNNIHRLLVVGVVAGTLIFSAVVAALTASTDYTPIGPPLPVDEVASMTAQLDSASIPYKLENGGTTIMIPKERLAKARVELAAHGSHAAGGGKGFELFDDMSLGATPFVQNVNYTRALQSELARSIMQLESVASARVIIARAEPSPFIRDQQPTTASVVLKLKPGAGMSRSTAAGIVSLVVRSVEGLHPENVTVVDSTGRLISDPHAGDEESLSSGQLEYRRDLEQYLSSRAEEMLARHLGAGRAIVRVSADLNFQKVREMKESYSPDERVARMEKTTSSDSGSSGDARGVAGAVSNLSRGGAGATGAAGNSGNRSKEETTQSDYLVSKTTREMESRMGGIQRLNVATLIDLTPQEGATGQTILSVKDAEEIVKQAIGFQAGRDEIKVSNVSLAGSVPAAEPGESSGWIDKAQTYVRLARNVSLMVAIVFLAATVMMVVRRFQLPALTGQPSQTGQLASIGQNGDLNGASRHPDAKRFQELASTDPQRVAHMLKVLLSSNGTVAR